jgi:hypothetical protein
MKNKKNQNLLLVKINRFKKKLKNNLIIILRNYKSNYISKRIIKNLITQLKILNVF